MNCCNAYGKCTQGKDCPARSTPLQCKNGGKQVDTKRDTPEDPREPQPWDTLDKVIWTLFKFCVGAFAVLTVVQISRWIHG